MLERIGKDVEAPIDQRVDQQESGVYRPAEGRRQATNEWQPLERHAEQQNEEQTPKELGQRHDRGRGEIGNDLRRPVTQVEKIEPADEPQRPGDHDGKQGKLDRRGQRVGDETGDALSMLN